MLERFSLLTHESISADAIYRPRKHEDVETKVPIALRLANGQERGDIESRQYVGVVNGINQAGAAERAVCRAVPVQPGEQSQTRTCWRLELQLTGS